MRAKVGRPSTPPEPFVCKQLLPLLDSVRDPTVFPNNRERLLEAEVAEEFLAQVVPPAREQGGTAVESFTVDVKALEAAERGKARIALRQRIREIPRWIFTGGAFEPNAPVEDRRSPGAVARTGAGQEARWSYRGNLLVDHRHGLIVGSVWEAAGDAPW